MENINVGDRVQIIDVGQGDKAQLNKFGRAIMIADGTNCIVMLDDGGTATVTVSQLKKVQ